MSECAGSGNTADERWTDKRFVCVSKTTRSYMPRTDPGRRVPFFPRPPGTLTPMSLKLFRETLLGDDSKQRSLPKAAVERCD